MKKITLLIMFLTILACNDPTKKTYAKVLIDAEFGLSYLPCENIDYTFLAEYDDCEGQVFITFESCEYNEQEVTYRLECEYDLDKLGTGDQIEEVCVELTHCKQKRKSPNETMFSEDVNNEFEAFISEHPLSRELTTKEGFSHCFINARR